MQAILRLAEATGGFGTVLQRGDADGGQVLLIVATQGRDEHLYERLAAMDGRRSWHLTRKQDTDDKQEFSEYLARRRRIDADAWIIEADVADRQRFVESLPV